MNDYYMSDCEWDVGLNDLLSDCLWWEVDMK